jgi:hypothetical protein
MVTKLWNKTESYVVAYAHPGCHHTSNAVDRPMNRLCRLMYAGRGLHGHQGSSEFRRKHYHEHWLHNLMVSTSLMGFRNPKPAIR